MMLTSPVFFQGGMIPQCYTCDGSDVSPQLGRHRYFHKLYALDAVLPDLGRPAKALLENAMQGHILGHAELIGQYQRSR